MTSDQQFAALVAIRMRRAVILDCLRNIKDPSPAWKQKATKDLDNLESAYEAIRAIKTED